MNGSKEEERDHEIETVKFFIANRSFTLKERIFILYIAPAMKGIKKRALFLYF